MSSPHPIPTKVAWGGRYAGENTTAKSMRTGKGTHLQHVASRAVGQSRAGRAVPLSSDAIPHGLPHPLVPLRCHPLGQLDGCHSSRLGHQDATLLGGIRGQGVVQDKLGDLGGLSAPRLPLDADHSVCVDQLKDLVSVFHDWEFVVIVARRLCRGKQVTRKGEILRNVRECTVGRIRVSRR